MERMPLVITVLGRDRPGIVQQLAHVVADGDGNWEESTLVRLAGRFAGVVKASVPDARIEALVSALEGLSGAGLQVRVERGEHTEDGDARVRIEVTATDRAGIVADVTRVLTAQQANIVELTTDYVDAPMSGGVLFHCCAEVEVPSVLELRLALESLQDDLQVDVHD
jgi:glycine cleavage system regulatory protein